MAVDTVVDAELWLILAAMVDRAWLLSHGAPSPPRAATIGSALAA